MPPSQPSIPAKRLLPAKESALFRELLSLYEAHQLKKAQKTADQILKKFPEHGETLAMKGLVTFQSGKKEEGLDLMRKGIRYDLTSHIVWHVFGLAKKADKDYEEAVKSYQQALRYEKDNLNILRDAANLHMQLRNFEALEEARLNMLRLRPNLRQNWIGLAVAHHLNGNLKQAKRVLETYEEILKNIPDYDVEHSEILLYHIRLMELLGEYEPGLNFLDRHDSNRRLMDPIYVMHMRARLLTKVGRREDANACWQDLIGLNPDCEEYYFGFMQNHGIDVGTLTQETRESCMHHLKPLLESSGHSTTLMHLALEVASGHEFRNLAQEYILNGLQKGIPSLFVDLKFLSRDEEKFFIIREISENIRDGTKQSDSDPLTLVWATYFLAQHSSHLGDHRHGLELVSEILEHTPTLPEVYSLKAKILKRAGDPQGASSSMEEARKLDGQDRFLNWKSAKYLLRASKVEEANEILGLFTKKDAPSPGYDLEEMQCLAYLLEEGDAYLRRGQLGLALKRYKSIQKVFEDIEDDQYDFHGYALRKFTINSYLNVLEWEDRIRSHETYLRSVFSAARIYIELYDSPDAATAQTGGHDTKTRKKPRKTTSKAQDDTNKARQVNPADHTQTSALAGDDDPDGLILLATENPLEQAALLLRPLEVHARHMLELWIVSFDVAIRRGKSLQAARALKNAYFINANDPELHIRIIEFQLFVQRASLTHGEEDLSHLILQEMRTLIPDEVTLETFNALFAQRHPNSAQAIWACARARHLLGEPEEYIQEAVMTTLLDSVTLNLETASQIFAYLSKHKSLLLTSYAEGCARRFPFSTIFQTQTGILQENGNSHIENVNLTEVVF